MADTLRVMQIEPPYVAARRTSTERPPLGAILLIDCIDAPPKVAQIRAVTDAAPWCPACVLAQNRWTVRHIKRTTRLSVIFSLDDPKGGVASVFKAIESRPALAPEDMAEWVVQRTRMPVLRRTLIDLFNRPLLSRADSLQLPWTTREQLALLGDWDACDWQEMWTAAAAFSRDASEPVDDALRALTGVNSDRLAGWEWIPEAALRRAGFFATERRSAREQVGTVTVLDAAARQTLNKSAWRRRAADHGATV